MRPLIIGPDERAALEDLVARALAGAYDARETLAAAQAKDKAKLQEHADRIARLTVKLPDGFGVVLTIEDGHPIGRCRHLSMWLDDFERLPAPSAVEMVMNELGFTGGLAACQIWIETMPAGPKAINIVQPVDPEGFKREYASFDQWRKEQGVTGLPLEEQGRLYQEARDRAH